MRFKITACPLQSSLEHMRRRCIGNGIVENKDAHAGENGVGDSMTPHASTALVGTRRCDIQ